MVGSFVLDGDAEDDDVVVVALETARVFEEHGDLDDAVKWLRQAAAAARQQGRPERAGELSRSAARVLGATGKFEPKEDEAHLLKDVDDEDSHDKTIVETTSEIISRNQQNARAFEMSEFVVDKPTPVAPLSTFPKAPAHQAIRVAVKRVLSGNFEARPLRDGESTGPGEREALLVPVQGGAKFT